ncbi:MAG: hypothetical protein KC619_34745 [Myxococcales bacterium]|nr:hypothetical protein [Myxococcales bacterium]
MPPPAPTTERVVWSAVVPDDWRPLSSERWILRVPPGYRGAAALEQQAVPDDIVLRYPDASLNIQTRDEYADARSVGERPPLSPDLVSRETCLE